MPVTDFEIDYKTLEMGELIGQGAFGRVFVGKWRGMGAAHRAVRRATMNNKPVCSLYVPTFAVYTGTHVAVKMLVCQQLTAELEAEFRSELAVLR